MYEANYMYVYEIDTLSHISTFYTVFSFDIF
jgi:hypothetical protein